ncbi:MAG: glycosyltransferase family 2 protein [Bacteroidota bacterium]
MLPEGKEKGMSRVLKVAVIIPCCNEQDSILNLVNEIENTVFPAKYSIYPLVINDCSTDNTRDILISNHIAFIDLSVNLGIGGAVQAGFKYACQNDFDIAVQMDGDGQHPPGELEKVLQPIFNNQADVVIGSRYIVKQGFQSSALRRFGINYFKRLNKFLTGVEIHDSTSGYRAISKKTMEIVSDYYPDEYPEPESIVLYSLNNLVIKEVPVIMRERTGGQSSIRTYKTIYYMFKVTLGSIFLYIRLKLNGKRHFI